MKVSVFTIHCNTMHVLLSKCNEISLLLLLGASVDDLVTADSPAGFIIIKVNRRRKVHD